MTSLQSMVDRSFEIAKEHIDDSKPDDQMMPRFLAFTGEEMRLYIAPWRNEKEKCLFLIFLKGEFKRHNVSAYVMTSEVWLSKRSLLESEPQKHMMPSQDPEREAALMVVGIDLEGTILTKLSRISVKNGKRRLLPLEDAAQMITGRILSLLDDCRQTKKTRH